MSSAKVIDLDAAAALVPDGARIAFGGGGAAMRRPMDFARALARRKATGLHVLHMLGGLETDLLIGAGCVTATSCAYVGLLEHGQAPNFQRAARERMLQVNEYSEFMYIASLRAADMGLPFIPWKTPWGSDMIASLGLRKVVNPYTGDALLAVPAAQIDVAVIQVRRADADGYVEMPVEPDLIWDYDTLVARVAATTIVCAEEIGPVSDPARVALIGREVTWVVSAPGGAWPTGLHPLYQPDITHLVTQYLPAALAGSDQFGEYLSRIEDGSRALLGSDG
ncbi:MAG: CoA-transferase [Solirubrobacteraceae bacterium]